MTTLRAVNLNQFKIFGTIHHHNVAIDKLQMAFETALSDFNRNAVNSLTHEGLQSVGDCPLNMRFQAVESAIFRIAEACNVDFACSHSSHETWSSFFCLPVMRKPFASHSLNTLRLGFSGHRSCQQSTFNKVMQPITRISVNCLQKSQQQSHCDVATHYNGALCN